MTAELAFPDSDQAASEVADGQHDAEGEADEILVSCRCESAKTVATLLQCLRHVATSGSGLVNSSSTSAKEAFMSQSKRHVTKSGSTQAMQPVTVFCSPSCLTFHMYGTAKQCQASVDLQETLFSYYQVAQIQPSDEGDPVEDWQAGGEFCVNLTKVLECLHVLGGQAANALEKTQLSFSYNASSEVFRVELLDQDSGIMITAAIPGMIPPEDDLGNSLALAFRSSPVASRMIVRSDTLKEIVQELELVSGAAQGTVSLGPSGLELACVGHLGECLVSIPCRGPHVVSLELPPLSEGSSLTKPRTFPLHSLLASMRGLEIAQETCITINTAGMMAIQHQVVDHGLGATPSFVDFILCCMEDEEDEEEEEQSSQQSQYQLLTSHPHPPSPDVETVRGSRIGPIASQTTSCSDEDDPTDDEEETNGLSMHSSRPLFGSLVAGHQSTASSPGDLHDRSSVDGSPDKTWDSSLRHKRRQAGQTFSSADRRQKDHDKRRRTQHHDANDDDRSACLLDDAEDQVGDDEEEDLEGESQPLDVTLVVAPCDYSPRDRDDGGCSSPELVYGRQD